MKKRKLIALLCLCTVVASCFTGCGKEEMAFTNAMNEGEDSYVFEETETYKNHIEVEGQWVEETTTGILGDVGIGDPFVMRFDGKYYMYPSSGTGGDNPGIKVYESEDLVNWTYKGFAANSPVLAGAYAPEVVYYNGLFYMATSPNGKGHYILVGDNPLGPFKLITDNFGCSIDGAFYVADDGELYLLYAGDGSSIKISPMDEATMLPDFGTALPASMNGWTEGPGIFRRGDILYLTYTGNHVHSKGYRVGYSYSMGEDPMGPYIMPENNIIILNCGEGAGSFAGLGHSSNVIGPNLDSWYAAYHNLYEGDYGKPRRLMVDQLVTNGAMLLANGPTYSEVAVPKRADFETRNVTNGFISDTSTEDIYTIEYNVTPSAMSQMDLMFAYKNEKNYTAVRWSMPNETMSLVTVKDGKETEIQAADMKGIKAGKLHTIRVEKGADKIEVYVDSMQKIDASSKGIGAGKIGVKGEATYSYTAFTNDVYGTSDFEAIKNLPSTFPAVHYLKGENRGWSIANAKDVEGGIRQNEAENTVKNEEDGISALVLDTADDWVKYAVNATAESYYGLAGTVTADSEGAKIQIIVDEKEVYTFTVPEVGDVDTEYAKLMLGQFPLTAGNHTLKIRLCSGKLQIQSIDIQQTNPSKLTYESAMDKINDRGWSYTGNWKIQDGAHTVKEGVRAFAYLGDYKMTDFSMEVDVAMLEEASLDDGGIFFHSKHHSLYSTQVSESMQGYYLAIRDDQITLERHNYGMDTLDFVGVELKKGEYHTVKIEMINNHIQVYLDDMDTPIMDCYDPNAFLSGQIALCSDNTAIGFKNVKIETQVNKKAEQ